MSILCGKTPSAVQYKGVNILPPEKSDELLGKLYADLGKKLPYWLRRCGVHSDEIEDVMQEVWAEAHEKRNELVNDASALHANLFKLASKVADRLRKRRMRSRDRNLCIDGVEPVDIHDEEAQLEARVTLLEAFSKLDKSSQALYYAHEIEGRTNKEIAAALNLKEDAVERRVLGAKTQLRAEIERRQTWKRTKRSSVAMGLLACDFAPLDRAILGTWLEITKRQPLLPSIRKFEPLSRAFAGDHIVMAVLAGTLSGALGLGWSERHTGPIEADAPRITSVEFAYGQLIQEVPFAKPDDHFSSISQPILLAPIGTPGDRFSTMSQPSQPPAIHQVARVHKGVRVIRFESVETRGDLVTGSNVQWR